MGSGSTEASDESVDASPASATGPDWGQVALVLLAAAILALAAVTIPPLGGVGFQGQGPAQPAGEEGSNGFLQLGSGDSGSGGSGDQQLGSGGSGSEEGTGDREGTGSADGEGSDSVEDGAGSGEDGDQPGEVGEGAGESGAGAGSGSNSGSEFDSGEGQQDGAAGDQSGDGSEVGSADGGADDPSQGEFGSGSGDGTAGDSGDGTAEEPGGQSDGTSTDGQGAAGDGTTSGDSDSSGDSADGAGSETGDGSGESAGDGAAGEDGSTTGDGDSSQDGNGGGDAGSGDDSSESDTQDSSDGNETDDGEDADDTGEDGTDDEDGTSYDISFDDQPTPGSTVAVTVTGDGEPVEGAAVYFNDEQVGTTDADGTVSGEVPYTETLEVRADVSPTETETTTARGSVSGPTLPGLDSSRQFHGTMAMPLSVAQDSQAGGESGSGNETESGARTTVEMNPETALTIDGEPIAGTNVTVVATVNGNPIPQGTVSVDGEEYGATNDDGAAVVSVPERPGNATIAVERGEIRAERTVAVEALSLTVEDRFPLPGRSVDARLEYGNESVANATILVDGAAAATTGGDGTATVGLPLADEATIAAEYEDARATTTVDGLYRNAALLALAVVVGVLLLWRLAARYGVGDRVRSLPSPASLLRRLGDALRTLGRRTVDAIVRLARSLESLGYWVAGRARAVVRALERAGRWLVALPGELATKGLAALAALHPVRLYRLLRDAIRSLLRSSRERVDDVSEAVTGTGAAAAGDEEAEEDVRTLRELWAEFVQLVRPPRLRTKTPGEVGRYAVEKGFPKPPVRTVVDAFRDSEYGETAPSEDRLERVRAAVRSVTNGAGAGADADDGRDGGSIDEDGDQTETEGDRL